MMLEVILETSFFHLFTEVVFYQQLGKNEALGNLSRIQEQCVVSHCRANGKVMTSSQGTGS